MSSKEVVAYGKVDEAGVLTIINKSLFYSSVANRFTGKAVELAARVKHKPKSNGQLGYYFGVCLAMIIAELEETQGERFEKGKLDDDLRKAYLSEEDISLVTGEVTVRIKSLKDLSTYEMILYIEDVRKWAAAALFIDIPDPNPNWANEIETEKLKANEEIK